ncbi:hypothetical protein NPX13_g2402 [Xylaria arbuscula]|uniref:Uncharacterized protein n=1 Tax=Xylaria arbuscula TaxID=114810 RepID=A0A9W8NK52_9PEZI|nr:hypothetical protein NPX13_g2402 [Xylaria arbuscula]
MLQRPPWLPHATDNSYYVGAYWITPGVWTRIFESLSTYPELLEFDTLDADLEEYVAVKLGCLLPDSNYHYSREQVSIWTSLMTAPMGVSNYDLEKIIPMERFEESALCKYETMPELPGFFLCTWSLSLSEYYALASYMKNKECTFNELSVWDTFIEETKLKPHEKIFIRYVGPVSAIAGPIGPMAGIFDQTEDARSGILADFLKALVTVHPTVAKNCECHIIQHLQIFDAGVEERTKFHNLIHSVLIEFFGAASLLNRRPNSSLSECISERSAILANPPLRFDSVVLEDGFRCPVPIAAELQSLFKSIEYVIPTKLGYGPDQFGDYDINNGMFRLDEARRSALLGQSMPKFYKGNRAIMIIAAPDLHINDYMSGRPFSFSHDPDNQAVGQLLSQSKNLDLRAMHAEPFAYFCLSPWPKFGSIKKDVVTYGKEMARMIVRESGYYGPYTTEVFLNEAGQPIPRRIGTHHFIHVPLMHPNRCRFGHPETDMAACRFMLTSFWMTMLIGDKILRVLDDEEAVKQEMARLADASSSENNSGDSTDEDIDIDGDISLVDDNPQDDEFDGDGNMEPPEARLTEPNDSQAICSLAMQAFQDTLNTTPWGKALATEFDDDAKCLAEVTKDVPLFMP